MNYSLVLHAYLYTCLKTKPILYKGADFDDIGLNCVQVLLFFGKVLLLSETLQLSKTEPNTP